MAPHSDTRDDDEPVDGWGQADDAWPADADLVDETTAPDYDGAGTYADVEE